MVRLIILLIGAAPFRRQWLVLLLLGVIFALVGVGAVFNLTTWYLFGLIDLIGVVCLIEGALGLASLLVIRPAHRRILRSHALALILLGLLAIDTPDDNNIGATLFFGCGFLIDGLLRIASAHTIRYRGWHNTLLIGMAELVLAALVFSDWPVPHRQTMPFCVGILLFWSGFNLCRLALQFRRLPAGASVLGMPFFRKHNWHRSSRLPELLPPSAPTLVPLKVHVWTPTGSVADPQRRMVVDRYIAAVDANGKISTGHAAMELAPDLYISLYPAEELNVSPDQFRSLLRAHKETDVPGRYLPSHEEEVAAWVRPDRLVLFRHYNEAALRAFWAAYRQDTTYNLTRRNCSSTVILALDAALEGVVGQTRPWYRFLLLLTDPNVWLLAILRNRGESMTWTPGLALDYARLLRLVSECQRQRWLVRRLNGLRAHVQARLKER
ncbi:hypothetical protein IGB42_02667 [Andreprevotia sp. IGB-42]|uniref:HdeD family acid-resistance protein n=1 Tax=Andreprevotia sp. IGB-42 TaxID=2497473 RepID=UPI00135B80AE|nr:hypothetical protein [Andreprevotia sp. IGB-42]KAF0812824.1 hypothetical protein IGB42_02667 [Andreprevotia sp. IGB-42]